MVEGILMLILNVPIHMTGMAKTGDKRVHVLNDSSRGASNCPQNYLSRVLQM